MTESQIEAGGMIVAMMSTSNDKNCEMPAPGESGGTESLKCDASVLDKGLLYAHRANSGKVKFKVAETFERENWLKDFGTRVGFAAKVGQSTSFTVQTHGGKIVLKGESGFCRLDGNTVKCDK